MKQNLFWAAIYNLLAIPVAELLTEQELTGTAGAYPPPKKGCGTVLEGDLGAMADRLIGILKEKTAVMR